MGHSSGGGTLPQIDLHEEVTPFEYGAPGMGEPGMTQYGDSPYYASGPVVGMANSARSMSPPSHYPNSSSENAMFNQQPGSGPGTGSDTSGSHYGPSSIYGGAAAGAAAAAMRVPSPPLSASQSQSRSSKEREAMTQRYGRSGILGLATQHEEANAANAGGQRDSSGADEVVVHSDGGRVHPDEEQGPREIPPAYDSIPADERSPR